MFYLVAYDIASSARLRRVHRIVRGYASGGQKSVYECFLSRQEREALYQQVESVIDLSEDRFLILHLLNSPKVHTLGVARPPQGPVLFYWED